MSEAEAHQDLPERWSSGRKTEIVLRLLRGEDLGAVSREIQVPPQELEDWRRVFLESGTRGLKRTGRDPTERELVRTRATAIGASISRLRQLLRESLLSREVRNPAVGVR